MTITAAQLGYGRKTVTTETGRIELEIPRDRQSTFDPQLIAKYQRRFPGFDDKIVSMYARGMSAREIVGHLRELYGIEVSPDLVSVVTDAVLEEIAAWQARPLEPVYPLVFFDALRVKVRDEGIVRNKAVHIALGVRVEGAKETPRARWRSATTGRRPAMPSWSAPSSMCSMPSGTRPWPASPPSSPIRGGPSRRPSPP